MELDSRKKSKRDSMMRSNSFETQEVREIGRKEPGESRGFPILWNGNNGRCLPDGRKGMRRSGKIEDMKKKIHARARKVLQHGIGNFVWASGSGRGKVGDSRKKFSESERRAKGRVRLHRARGSVELREVASGSTTQNLWLRNGKVGSQVSGVDRSRFSGRRTVGEVRRGGTRGRRTGDRAKEKVHRFRVRSR